MEITQAIFVLVKNIKGTKNHLSFEIHFRLKSFSKDCSLSKLNSGKVKSTLKND